jgi:urocanate hydratase
MVIVADGSRDKEKRLNLVLTNDPGLGIARYADAGYKAAKKFASTNEVNIPKG